MKLFNWNIEFYNVRKHRPTFWGVDTLTSEGRMCRPFAEADIHSVLLMLSNRLQNVVFLSDKNFQILEALFIFIKKNTYKLLLKLFYEGYVVLDLSRPFAVQFSNEEDVEVCAAQSVVFYDNVYISTGKTRAQILSPQIELLNVINDSDLNLILNYGAMGILSPENSSRLDGYLDEEQIKEIQRDYKEKYGVRFGKWALLITKRPVKFQKIDLPIKDLELTEKRKVALSTVLQFMNIPKELHALFENAKYTNRNEAELDMYGNAVSAWARVFCDLIKKCYEKIVLFNEIEYPRNIELWFDIVGVPALQEAQYVEKLKVREEVKMWQDLMKILPEKSEVCRQRIENLIENI